MTATAQDLRGVNIVTTTLGGSNCTGLANAYDANAMVIRVPQLRSLTINAGRRVVGSAWNGTVGGAVVLEVGRRADDTGGVLSFSGDGRIDISGRGFRGGAL